MVGTIGTWRTLRQLARYSNQLKRTNRIVIRTLTTQSHLYNSIVNHIAHRGIQFEFVRNYGEWAPNVVRSPYPDFEMPNQLFHEFFWSKHEKWGDLPAVVCGFTGRETTYFHLRQLCRRMATSLLKEGYKSGQVIAIVLPNMPEYPVVALGIIEAGLILSPINPIYTADEIAYQLKNSSSVAVITIPDKLDAVQEAKSIIRTEDEEAGSKIRIICTPDVFGNEAEVPTGVERYSHFVGDNVDISALPSLQTRDRTQNDVTLIPYSSGTTGKPKGVCLTHSNLIASILNTYHNKDIEEATNGKQEVIPCILPAFHIYGFTIVMSHGMYHGAKMVMLPIFEENSFLNVLAHYKPTVLYVAPPLVIYLGASPAVTKDHLQSIKYIVSAAAPCSELDILRCVNKFPSTIVYTQGYGLTETSPVVTLMLEKIKKYSSVGAPTSNTVIKVADLQTGQALGPSEEGEICVKGPQVMKGYLNNEIANSDVFDSDGWFHTGDIGYYDTDKHFFITDRLKELIKVKGFQVAPAELESVLRSHPDIEDAGVIGVPDPRKGETPIGFVKVKKGATPTDDDLKAFLSQKVAKYKQIDTFVFVDSIPKSATGKILRKNLKENYLNKVNLDNYLKEKEI